MTAGQILSNHERSSGRIENELTSQLLAQKAGQSILILHLMAKITHVGTNLLDGFYCSGIPKKTNPSVGSRHLPLGFGDSGIAVDDAREDE